MPMSKQKGNMYPWVTHMHGHLRGQCPHECTYCYTQHMRCKRFYQGELKLKEDELGVNYGDDNTIFIEHMNDLFAEGVPGAYIVKILRHCHLYENNTYVFQTKNPGRMFRLFAKFPDYFPEHFMVGTTIETDREDLLKTLSKAPPPIERFVWISAFKKWGVPTFITVEPVMDFGLELIHWLVAAKPDFVNIGADSKNCGLMEPRPSMVNLLVETLKNHNIEVREKHNLERLMSGWNPV